VVESEAAGGALQEKMEKELDAERGPHLSL